MENFKKYNGKLVEIYQNPVTRDEASFEGLARIKEVTGYDKNFFTAKVEFNFDSANSEIVERRFIIKDIHL